MQTKAPTFALAIGVTAGQPLSVPIFKAWPSSCRWENRHKMCPQTPGKCHLSEQEPQLSTHRSSGGSMPALLPPTPSQASTHEAAWAGFSHHCLLTFLPYWGLASTPAAELGMSLTPSTSTHSTTSSCKAAFMGPFVSWGGRNGAAASWKGKEGIVFE